MIIKKYLILALISTFLLMGFVSAATVTIYPTNSSEPYRYRSESAGENLTTIRAGNGTGIYVNTIPIALKSWNSSTTMNMSTLARGLYSFDLSNTSVIPANATITGITFSVWGRDKYADLGSGSLSAVVTNASPTNIYNHSQNDFQLYGQTILANNITYTDWSSSNTSRNNFTLNAAGVSLFQSKIGSNVSVMMRTSWDVDGVFGGTFANFSESAMRSFGSNMSGTSLDPFIEVTYAEPSSSSMSIYATASYPYRYRSTTATEETLATIRAGNGTGIYYTALTAGLRAGNNSAAGNMTTLTRGLYSVDLSTLPTGATITAVNLSTWGRDKWADLGSTSLSAVVVNASPANPWLHASSDYQLIGNTVYSSSNISYADWSSSNSSYNTFPLNAAAVAYFQSRIGTNASVGLKTSWDVDNVFPGTYVNFSESIMRSFGSNMSGTSVDPYFTIYYTSTTSPSTATATFTHAITQAYNSSYGKYIDNEYRFQFNSSAISAPLTAYQWYYTNVTGNNTPVMFSTSANPTQVLDVGNWSIQLNASTASTYNMTPHNHFINISLGYPAIKTIPTGYQFYSSDYIYNVPIDTMPVDSRSSIYTGFMAASSKKYLSYNDAMPFNVVGNETSHYNVSFRGVNTAMEDVAYPIPPYPRVQGGFDWNSSGDHHVLILDKDEDALYELYQYDWDKGDTWYSGIRFDLSTYTLKPDGESSVDLAGFPMLPLFARYDEVASGKINHTLRIAFPYLNASHIWPARNHIGSSHANAGTNGTFPPTGQYFRLKSSYDISGFGTQSKVIATALKKYGAITSDQNSGGNRIYLDINTQWSSSDLSSLNAIPMSAFEAVDVSSLMIDEDSGQALVDYPVAEFTSDVTSGSVPLSVQFNDTSLYSPTSWTWDFGDGATSGVRNATHTYESTGVYTVSLTVSNAGGSSTETKTNYITAGSNAPISHFLMNLSSAVPDMLSEYGYLADPSPYSVGGGAGYSPIYTTGDYIVTTKAQLLSALSGATSGQVIYVTPGVNISMDGETPKTIPAGVILASNRGYGGSTGAVIKKTVPTSGYSGLESMFIMGTGARVTGLVLEGEMKPEDDKSVSESDYLVGLHVPTSTSVEVDNCEIRGWSWAGVRVLGTATVHHNYIHSCQADGEGYGSVVEGGTLTAQSNRYNYNRHSIAASGVTGERYYARYNYIMSGGGDVDYAIAFDVHANPYDSGAPAGYDYFFQYNTFEWAPGYYITGFIGFQGRGPSNATYINNNEFNWEISDSIEPVFIHEDSATDAMHVSNNKKGDPLTLRTTDSTIVDYLGA